MNSGEVPLRQYLGGPPAGDNKSSPEGESERHIQRPSHEEMRLEELSHLLVQDRLTRTRAEIHVPRWYLNVSAGQHSILAVFSTMFLRALHKQIIHSFK